MSAKGLIIGLEFSHIKTLGLSVRWSVKVTRGSVQMSTVRDDPHEKRQSTISLAPEYRRELFSKPEGSVGLKRVEAASPSQHTPNLGYSP